MLNKINIGNMKHFLIILTVLSASVAVTSFTSCGSDDPETEVPNPNPNPDPDPQPPVTGNKGNIRIGSTTFTVTFQDNETASAFKQRLPMTINMSELNNNEKFFNLPNALPTNASNPGTIQNGDLMLYGSSTLVLFYKSFSTSYSYTRIGRIDNPSGLESALGNGSVSVTIEMQ